MRVRESVRECVRVVGASRCGRRGRSRRKWGKKKLAAFAFVSSGIIWRRRTFARSARASVFLSPHDCSLARSVARASPPRIRPLASAERSNGTETLPSPGNPSSGILRSPTCCCVVARRGGGARGKGKGKGGVAPLGLPLGS